MTSITELHWAAGFLEGEGSFVASSKHSGNIQVTCAQVQREPLDRLAKLFGGFFRQKHYVKYQSQWMWAAQGSLAVQVMMTLYPLMSTRRKEQIRVALRMWKTWGVANKFKTHCSAGHALDGDNLIIQNRKSTGRKRRVCRTCRDTNWRAFEERRRGVA